MLDDVELSNSGSIGKVKAVAISALFFGATHFLLPKNDMESRISHVASSTFGGLIYGAEYVLTGNLWASTITHSLFNGRGFLL